MPKTQKHIHKLRRHKYKTGNAIFFCTLPDCHFKIDKALAIGKRSLCNICDTEFIMNEYTIKLVRPHCQNCGKVKIKSTDGKSHFVKKLSNQILSDIAIDSHDELRERLNNVTEVDLEHDI